MIPDRVFEACEREARAMLNAWNLTIEALANSEGGDMLLDGLTIDLLEAPIAALLGAIHGAEMRDAR